MQTLATVSVPKSPLTMGEHSFRVSSFPAHCILSTTGSGPSPYSEEYKGVAAVKWEEGERRERVDEDNHNSCQSDNVYHSLKSPVKLSALLRLARQATVASSTSQE